MRRLASPEARLSIRTRGCKRRPAMKKISKKQRAIAAESKPEKVVGLDLGDRYSHYCMLTDTGELMEEGRIQSTAAALEKQFGNESRMRIALETGTHSPWISRLLESYGHQVIVALSLIHISEPTRQA